MAFKSSAARCSRLTPPSSPTRWAVSTAPAAAGAGAPKPRSRLLAALDAEIDFNALYMLNGSGEARAAEGKGRAPTAGASSGSVLKNPAPLSVRSPVPPGFTPYTRNVPNTLVPVPGVPHQSPSPSIEPKPKPRGRKAAASADTEPVASSSKVTKAAAKPRARKAAAPRPKARPVEEGLQMYSWKDYSSWSPQVHYVRTEEEANELVKRLKGPVGFDMEWNITLYTGYRTVRKTAVVQLCDRTTILLVHLAAMKKFPRKVKELLEDPKIEKVGVNIRQDGVKLFGDFHVAARNLVELGSMAHQADPAFTATYKRKIVSLAKMVALYTRRELDKEPDIRMGNWETKPLPATQQTYAANDVHSGLIVYLTLCNIARMHRVRLDPAPYTSDIAAEHGLDKAPDALTADWAELAAKTLPAPPSLAPRPPPPAVPKPPAPPPAFVRSAWNPSAADLSDALASVTPREHPRLQRAARARAYELWHREGQDLDAVRAALRTPKRPLAATTAISYIVWALQGDARLPYELPRLKALVESDAMSWFEHGPWVLEQVRRQQAAEAAAEARKLDAAEETGAGAQAVGGAGAVEVESSEVEVVVSDSEVDVLSD
ncbi:ribonuclease H-like protein [Phanerochaete sordida]|uniref:Ribonuclease H-like protein n=1 Tax=Phanerochaete sordida TaxID=48140 RepID=A0A9P3GPC7_9APHY|nr:ribonuclease H-like protein [Phanerochaete sordida]